MLSWLYDQESGDSTCSMALSPTATVMVGNPPASLTPSAQVVPQGPVMPPAPVTPQESEQRALSIHYIAGEFVRQVESAGLSRISTVHDIEDRVIRGPSARTICPRDGRMGAAYVDVVRGNDNVGQATHMLSYTWRYSVAEIAESLTEWSARAGHDPRRFYVWMCCVCVNQHRVKEKQQKGESVPFDEFKQVFEGRVKGIGKVIALMMPWHAPAFLTRSWCMLEMHTAIGLGDSCELTIVMPPNEEDAFTFSLIHSDGLERVYKTLQGASIEQARASMAEDEVNILRLVKEGQGVKMFDEQLKKHLQGWFLRVANDHVRSLPMKLLTACSKVGKMTSDLGDLDHASTILTFGWSNMSMTSFLSDKDAQKKVEVTGDLWHEQGWINHKRGHRKSAIKDYEEGLNPMAALDGLRNMSAARLYRGRARALVGDEPDQAFLATGEAVPSDEDIQMAISDYIASLEILREQEKVETEDGAKLFNNLGLAHTLRSDFEAALAAFGRAGEIREGQGSTQDPGNARRLYNLASMHLKRSNRCSESAEAAGYSHEAVLLFREAVRLLQAASVEPELVEKCNRKLEWIREHGVSDPVVAI
ncbi:unnamed protein product [Polarella glacialis]|uniref:Uncharacterized protein n=1 Tax=Polarella glacialis TaxID=89957 RepID=A0A813HPY6_POLGL|nr:unnamed protein product [Polarella glacialis]